MSSCLSLKIDIVHVILIANLWHGNSLILLSLFKLDGSNEGVVQKNELHVLIKRKTFRLPGCPAA